MIEELANPEGPAAEEHGEGVGTLADPVESLVVLPAEQRLFERIDPHQDVAPRSGFCQ